MASFEKSGYTKDRTTSRHTQRQWLTPVVTAVFAPQKTSLPPRARTCGRAPAVRTAAYASKPAGITVRRAREGDLPQVGALIADAFWVDLPGTVNLDGQPFYSSLRSRAKLSMANTSEKSLQGFMRKKTAVSGGSNVRQTYKKIARSLTSRTGRVKEVYVSCGRRVGWHSGNSYPDLRTPEALLPAPFPTSKPNACTFPALLLLTLIGGKGLPSALLKSCESLGKIQSLSVMEAD
ncbi:hypothetical protein WJX84_000331 [Apatococcus fuscideae]|uniref:Uncharacterized protein n=1 Tax=Apatococcus fuscideae TaxID=2026836 RepID=A0AAW1SP73_9CHLO